MCLCPSGVDTPMNQYLQHVGMTEAGRGFLDSLGIVDDADSILRPEDVAEAAIKVKGV